MYADRVDEQGISRRVPADEHRGMFEELRRSPGYTSLANHTPLVTGIMDDHDYGKGIAPGDPSCALTPMRFSCSSGVNDCGANEIASFREESKNFFLDFLGEPEDSPRRSRPGLFWSHTIGPPGRRIKLILLDIRFNKDPPGNGADLLGREQWEWLENELEEPADLRIVASSVIVTLPHALHLLGIDSLVEGWWTYPEAKAKLFTLLSTKAPTVLLSGDLHGGVLQEYPPGCLFHYRLLELTSSGMTHTLLEDSLPHGATPFTSAIQKLVKTVGASLAWPFRQPRPVLEINFGTVEVDWSDGSVLLALRNASGIAVESRNVSLSDLLPLGDGRRESLCLCERISRACASVLIELLRALWRIRFFALCGSLLVVSLIQCRFSSMPRSSKLKRK